MTSANAPQKPSWKLPLLLIFLTFLSTTFVGAAMAGVNLLETGDFAAGAPFSIPLMAILLAHEFGHYLAAKRHGVPSSPPYFIPMPFFLLGTMGAFIAMRGRIKRRDALLDVGAAGPLAGLAVALPVLVYGFEHSPVEPLPSDMPYLMEGRSLLYMCLLFLVKGPIPEGYDIMLTPTAFAGWAGLLVTMINLLPVGQLDGGHVAYALLGPKQELVSKRVRAVLPVLALAVGAAYGGSAYLDGTRGDALWNELSAGMAWLVWWGLLLLLKRATPSEHPETDPGHLSPRRRQVAVATLALFALLFMPCWMREVVPVPG